MFLYSKGAIQALTSLSLSFALTMVPGVGGMQSDQAVGSETFSLSVAGFSVSWPNVMYEPDGCSKFEFRFINNAPREFLQVGFQLTDPFGGIVAGNSLVGAPPGRTGIWDTQICKHNINNGLGPYRIKVFIKDYSSNGGGTLEQYADLFFTSRSGQSASPTTPSPPSNNQGSTATSLSVAGFSVSWPNVMYEPDGCSKFEFRFINNAPREFLQVGFQLTDPFGGIVAGNSLVGAPPGRTGIWDTQICKHNINNGLGPYRIKVFIKDYSSNGGGTLEQYADLFFTSRSGSSAGPATTALPRNTSATSLVSAKATTKKKYDLQVRVTNAIGKKIDVFVKGRFRGTITAASNDFSFRVASGLKGRHRVQVNIDNQQAFARIIRVR